MDATANSVSIASRIRRLAVERPDDVVFRHIALDGSEPAFTWSELDRRSDQLGAALLAKGLNQGDRIALGLRNSPQFVLSVLAAWKIGAIPVPVRWDLPEWELNRLKDVVAAPIFLGPDDLAWIDQTETTDVTELPDAISPLIHGICSSGSTGTPKVIITDRPGVWMEALGGVLYDEFRPVPRPQTVLVPAPMYHTNGLTTLYNLLAGDTLILLEKFDAARIVDVIERYKVTNFTATPTMLQRIADLPDIEKRDLSSIYWFTQGAAPMPPSLVHRWADLVGAEKILMAYGMTEGLGLSAILGHEWMSHQGSVGRGVRGTQIRICDAEGKELPTGEVGDIYLRSPYYGGSHYLGKAPQLLKTDDGFYSVGDMGRLDEDGYLYLADRRVDMIITGGANVFPAEIEAGLIDHPQVADVVVIGLKDPEWGRRVHAIIEPTDPADPPTAAEIIAYAKSRLAAYKVPKTVEFVEAIPRSEATKVNRGALVAARDA